MKARVPPHSIEAEQSVLAGIMIEPKAWDTISDKQLGEHHFYSPAHRKIFFTIKELNGKSQPIDIVTVTNSLQARNELNEIGNPAYLAEMINNTPSAANIGAYVDIIIEKSLLRETISKCTDILNLAYDGDFEDIDRFIDTVESTFFGLTDKRNTSGLVGARDLIHSTIHKIEELYNTKSAVTGVPTGFVELDKATTGFQPGELIIVAARPSMGKTALGLNITANAALRGKKKVAFFSLEMPSQQIMIRFLASESKISIGDVRVGRIGDTQWQDLIGSAAKLAESKIWIDDTTGISPSEIRAKCRRIKATEGLDMIVIDYLQMMDLKSKVESRERAVSEISRGLKALAKELKIPVVALAQLNRQSENRKDRRPMLSDLRESGSIEQDADVIMMIYRDEYYEKDNSEQKGVAEIIIGKQRNGPVGTVKVAWLGQYGVFANLANEGAPQGAYAGAQPVGSVVGVPSRPTPRSDGGAPASSGGIKNFAPKGF